MRATTTDFLGGGTDTDVQQGVLFFGKLLTRVEAVCSTSTKSKPLLPLREAFRRKQMHRSSNQELMLRHNKPIQMDLELNSADVEEVVVPCIYLRNDITAEKKRAVLVGCIGWPRASVGRIADLAPLARGGFGTVHALRVFPTSLPGPGRLVADDDGSCSTFSTSMAKGPLTSLQHQRQSQDELPEQVEDAEPRHALKLVRVDLSEKMTEHNEGLDADNFLRTYRELVFSTTLKHRNVMAVLGAWTFTDPFASHRWSLSMLMRFAACDFTKLGGKKLNQDYAKLEKYVAQLAAGFRCVFYFFR